MKAEETNVSKLKLFQFFLRLYVHPHDSCISIIHQNNFFLSIVGHCHPHVVAASQTQMQKLWTTQGFLNDTYSLYMKKLMDVLPETLSVVYLVNSG